MLRDAVERRTPGGRDAERFMDTGELVPDRVVLRLMADVFDAGDGDACYLLDGFPRTVAQAEQLDDVLRERGGCAETAVLLDVPDTVLVDRLAGRRVCPKCKKIYHIETLRPKVDDLCDKCDVGLVQRDDDTVETVLHRLEVYREQTAPVIEQYRADGRLVTVDGLPRADAVAETVAGVLADRAEDQRA